MKRPILIAAFATLLVPRMARAADDLEELLDQSVVTTASNAAETESTAPATSTVIGAEDLRRYGIRSVAEAIDFLSLGAMAEDGDLPGARGVTIGNLSSRHFLILIDGSRVNDLVYGTASLGRFGGLPIEIVDHVEVVLGPGSVLYGSNAMVGVLNIVTRRAKDWDGVRVGGDADLVTGLRPWAGFGARTKVFGLPLESTTQVEYARQWGPSLYYAPVNGGIDITTGRPVRYDSAAVGTGIWGGREATNPSRAESVAVVGRLALDKLELNYNIASRVVPAYLTPQDFDVDAKTVFRRVLLDLRYEAVLSSVARIRFRSYANLSDTKTAVVSSHAPECPFLGITCHHDIFGEGRIRGAEITPSFDWFRDGRFVTMLGVEGAWRRAQTKVDVRNQLTGDALASSTGLSDNVDFALAGYAQQTWTPVREVGFNAGARLEYDSRFDPVTSPRLAARVSPWKSGTFKAIYAEAFRAPSAQESYFSHPQAPAAENLRPEHAQSVEGSFEQRFGARKILVGAFAMRWTDLIELHNFSNEEALAYFRAGKSSTPPSYQYRNVAEVTTWGMNAGFEGSELAQKLRYGLNVTTAVARESEDDHTVPLALSPRIFGNARVSYDLGGLWPTLGLAASLKGTRGVEDGYESFSRPWTIKPQLLTRATITGAVPRVPGLSYRITGLFAANDRSALVAGPHIVDQPPSLMPVDTARVTVGLTYELGK